MAANAKNLTKALRKIAGHYDKVVKAFYMMREDLKRANATNQIEAEDVNAILAKIENSGLLTTGDTETDGNPQPQNATAAIDSLVKDVDSDPDIPTPPIVAEAMESTVDTAAETDVTATEIAEEIIGQ